MAWVRSEDDDSGLLTMLLDVTPSLWGPPHSIELGPRQLVEQVLAFINTYILINSSNKLAVFASGGSGSYLLYQNLEEEEAQEDCTSMESQLLGKLQQVLSLEAATPGHHISGLSSGLSRALCYINRALKQGSGPGGGPRPSTGGGSRARLLCLTGSPDDSRQYIAVMNAIFSAQRSEVSIDCCKLGEGHSTFLQQAAYLTGGIYIRPTKPAALLEYLLSAYAPDPFSRMFLHLPRLTTVDFRASCFCHKRSIDIGFVCSVCLSIFCEKLPACITCGADFRNMQAAPPAATPH